MSASGLLGPLTSIPSRSAQIPLDSAVTTHSRRPLVWNTVPLSIPLTWPLCTLPWEPAGHLLSVHSPRGQREQLSQAWGRPGATALTPASALGARETRRARPGLVPRCLSTCSAAAGAATLGLFLWAQAGFGRRSTVHPEVWAIQMCNGWTCLSRRSELGCPLHIWKFDEHAQD